MGRNVDPDFEAGHSAGSGSGKGEVAQDREEGHEEDLDIALESGTHPCCSWGYHIP